MNIAMKFLSGFACLFIVVLLSCSSDDPEIKEPPVVAADSISVTVNVASTKQEMIGFGGALTWYANWLTGNTKVNEISDLMFTDLGIDIIRFKNWYYPDNYPTNKLVSNMSSNAANDYAKAHWDATNQLYNLAVARNSNIKILLSSWGPPVSLKSNGVLQQGTLKKDGSAFMYDAFAEYWNDVLDYVPFDPDYISIQNEPTYVNAGWTTSQWAINETTTLPGFNTAFNKVYDKIKTREHVPVMMGPESQDIPTFVSFSNVLKDNPNCGVYAWHPYNINSGTTDVATINSLKSIGAFTTKPNVMTEFSDNISWFKTAVFIQNSLVHANASGYIYWKLMWATPAAGEEDAGMISLGSASTSAYAVTPYYHLIKHFSKNIDAGYHRVEATTTEATLITSAFVSPDGEKLTIIIVNTGTEAEKTHFVATGKTATAIRVVQSKEGGSYYSEVPTTSPTKSINLPAKSITTVVLDI